MAILKIRDADGKVYEIPSFVHDGGASNEILNSLIETAEVITASININPGIYEYGRFGANGQEWNTDTPIEGAFRSATYVPVTGGRTIGVYYDAYEWNNNNKGWSCEIVQYDADKNILVPRVSKSTIAADNQNTWLTLDVNTAYIRVSVNRNVKGDGTTVLTPLTDIKLAVYYKEDAVKSYVEYGGVSSESYMIRRDKVNGLEPLRSKKIVYDGDSIAESRSDNGGGYAKLIADYTGGFYANQAVGGARLCANSERHSVVNNLENLPKDGDLYCFQGGINDFWGNTAIGECTSDFTGAVDSSTICGAMETIFRYALTNFVGKPICFVITHKVQNTFYSKNTNGNTFKDYRDAMVKVCEKYSIPYYDAFYESGLNGWNTAQNNAYFSNGDGTHPNADGYKRYYMPQLLTLFRSMIPVM